MRVASRAVCKPSVPLGAPLPVLGEDWGFLLPPPLATASETNSLLGQCSKVTTEYLGGGCQLGFNPPGQCFPMEMGGGFAMNSFEGIDLRCDGRNGIVDVFNGFEASLYTPLNFYPLVVLWELLWLKF